MEIKGGITSFRSVCLKYPFFALIICCCCYYVASVVSDSVWPHRRQPTRLPRPWDSPGKNTGVRCHFLLQGMKVKSESEVTQSCPTLSDPVDCNPPGFFVHGIFQARVVEWGAIAFSAYYICTDKNVKKKKKSKIPQCLWVSERSLKVLSYSLE